MVDNTRKFYRTLGRIGWYGFFTSLTSVSSGNLTYDLSHNPYLGVIVGLLTAATGIYLGRKMKV